MTMSNELRAGVGAGGSKLAGAPAMVEIFHKVGVGQWFRYFTGLVEFTAGIGLLISRYAFYAALALAVVMIGATIAQLTVLAGSPAAPVALLVLNWVIAYARSPASAFGGVSRPSGLITRIAWAPSHAAAIPTATPTAVSTSRKTGCRQASCGLNAATTIMTAIVIPVVMVSSGRPIVVTTITPIPISAAMPQT